MTAPLLLRGVDRAAFAVALVARLRAAGVLVSASGPAGFVQALDRLRAGSRQQLYWWARLTLVNRAEDLAAFDAVFAEVFAADSALLLDRVNMHNGPGGSGGSAGVPGPQSRGGAAVDDLRHLDAGGCRRP